LRVGPGLVHECEGTRAFHIDEHDEARRVGRLFVGRVVRHEPEAGDRCFVENAAFQVVVVLELVAHVHIRRRRPAHEAGAIPRDDAFDLGEHVVRREELAGLRCGDVKGCGSDDGPLFR